jgi:hypothetical protein
MGNYLAISLWNLNNWKLLAYGGIITNCCRIPLLATSSFSVP